MTTTRAAQSSGRWLVRQRPRAEAKLRLFCLPYAGGGAMIYRNWAEALPPQVEVCAVQLPGRENRLGEPPFEEMSPLVEALAAAIAPELDRPFALFGHSMGAKIGFELARHLRRASGPVPAHLFVAGCRAPQSPRRRPGIHALPEAEFIGELGRLGGTPPEVLAHAELMRLMMPMLRADTSLCDTYSYEPCEPLNCPVTAFGGLSDADVTPADVEAWRGQTRAAFSFHLLPGDHFFINSERNILLQLLARALHRLAAGLG